MELRGTPLLSSGSSQTSGAHANLKPHEAQFFVDQDDVSHYRINPFMMTAHKSRYWASDERNVMKRLKASHKERPRPASYTEFQQKLLRRAMKEASAYNPAALRSALISIFMINDLRGGDGNGTLDLDEYRSFIQDELKLNQSERDVRTAFHYLDADRSGSIDVEEIVNEVMVVGAAPMSPVKGVNPLAPLTRTNRAPQLSPPAVKTAAGVL